MMKIVLLFSPLPTTLLLLFFLYQPNVVYRISIKDTTNNNDERILRKHENKKNDVDKEETQTCDWASYTNPILRT
jgi:hypothetical protein